MLLDGTEEANRRLENMLHWDVNNGVARRAWQEILGRFHIQRAMERNHNFNRAIIWLMMTSWNIWR